MDQQDNQTMPPPQSQSTPATPQIDQPAASQPGQIPAVPVTPTPSPTSPASAPVEEVNYITNVGQSMVDLLTDISTSDTGKQKIAAEMNIPVEQIETLCNGLLEKIDSQIITEAELAFLLTAPITESGADQDQST